MSKSKILDQLDDVIDESHISAAEHRKHMQALNDKSTCPCRKCRDRDYCKQVETCMDYRRWRAAYLEYKRG